MLNIFYNSDEARIRALWRIIITTILIISLVIVWALIFQTRFWITLGLGFIVPSILWLVSKFIENRHFPEFGLFVNKTWVQDFIAGNIMAAFVMSAMLLLLIYLGFAEVTSITNIWENPAIVSVLFQSLIFMLAVSLWEEAYFRGYLITNMKEGFQAGFINKQKAMVIAVIVSSIIFGAAHSGNPNASLFAVINIFMAGVVLAYPYIKSKSLGISVGMHLSWNYFQGVVFGMPVSGLHMSDSFAETKISGPELITGGQFGPEGGAAGLVGLLMLAVICHLYLALFYKK
ncbi:MAG: CPBP family intramembrane metalloprotease [Balneolaceae bacterium]|nr:MAG: CPBP family intramembrane metalloprotease [Balneolaceae bacterium]